MSGCTHVRRKPLSSCRPSAPAPQTHLSRSERYYDDVYEYRHVVLPQDIAKRLPKDKLLSEPEWRALGVQQSRGWDEYILCYGHDRRLRVMQNACSRGGRCIARRRRCRHANRPATDRRFTRLPLPLPAPLSFCVCTPLRPPSSRRVVN